MCNTHNVKLEPCVPYHTKAKCPRKKGCPYQHGFPTWLPNTFCAAYLRAGRCQRERCSLSHEPVIELIKYYKNQLTRAVLSCRDCQNLRGPTSSEREDRLPNAYRTIPNDGSSGRKGKKKKKNRANSEDGGIQSTDHSERSSHRSRSRSPRQRPERSSRDSSELEIVEERRKRRRSRSSRSAEKDGGRRRRSRSSNSSRSSSRGRKKRKSRSTTRKGRDSRDDSSDADNAYLESARNITIRRERSKSRSTRASTRSRSRDRSVRSSDRYSLEQSSDLGAGSAKSRLGPKSSRSRSSSGEWRKVQENRSNSRTMMRSQTSGSRSPIAKRLGPKISPSVK